MTPRATRLLIIIVVAGGLAIVFWLFRARHEPSLKIDFAGYTNRFRGEGREAIIAVTNQSEAMFIVTFLPEHKNPEWPIHKNIPLHPHLILAGHDATNVLVRLQPNDGIWRVRVLYRNPITKWQITRNRWSVKLRVRHWDRVAAWVEPDLADVFLTPEMEL
jgi:hypothetical protein